MHDRHFDHRARRTFLQWLAGLGLIGVIPQISAAMPRGPDHSRDARSRELPARESAIKLFLCGDVMTGRAIDQVLPHPGDPRLYEPYVRDARQYVQLAEMENGPIAAPVNFDYVWGDALDTLERLSPDVRLINLETAITASGDYWPQKGIHYRMHPRNLPAITAAGIQCCTLANNHVLDWGYSGLADTLGSLRRAGIATIGSGRDRQEACAPAILPVPDNGRVIALGFGHRSSGIPRRWAATRTRPGVCLLDDLSERTVSVITKQARKVKRDGDILVVSIHWGENWGYEIPEEQRRFTHQLIDDAGVDLVHGHSSHHVKGIEIHHGRLILYGCGDFLNDYEGIGGHESFRGDLSLMFFPTLEPATGRLLALRMVPTRVRRFRITRAERGDVAWLQKRLNREGKRFGTQVDKTPDNSLVLRLD